jgi:hypothetical protein
VGPSTKGRKTWHSGRRIVCDTSASNLSIAHYIHSRHYVSNHTLLHTHTIAPSPSFVPGSRPKPSFRSSGLHSFVSPRPRFILVDARTGSIDSQLPRKGKLRQTQAGIGWSRCAGSVISKPKYCPCSRKAATVYTIIVVTTRQRSATGPVSIWTKDN